MGIDHVWFLDLENPDEPVVLGVGAGRGWLTSVLVHDERAYTFGFDLDIFDVSVCFADELCIPDCDGKDCGDDGCGGSCGGSCGGCGSGADEGCFEGHCETCPEAECSSNVCSADGLSKGGGCTTGPSGCTETNWMPCNFEGGPGSTCYLWTDPEGTERSACSCEGSWTSCNAAKIKACCPPGAECQVFSETSTGCR